MKRIAILILIAAVLIGAGGCMSRAAKEAVLSPKGLSVTTSVVASPQQSYSKLEVSDFANTGITTMPANMNNLVRTALAERIADLPSDKGILRTGAARTLVVQGRYLYYESSSGMLDQVFGPFEEVIALVELVDKSSGKVISRGYCVGRTNTTRLQGPRRKAEGLAKAIIELIRKSCKT